MLQLAPGFDQLRQIALGGVPAEAHPERAAAGEVRRHAHRLEHMRAPDLARRASRARGDRDAQEIERHDRGFGHDSVMGEAAGVGQAPNLLGEDPNGRRNRPEAGFEAIARYRNGAGIIAERRLERGCHTANRGDVFGSSPQVKFLTAAGDHRR